MNMLTQYLSDPKILVIAALWDVVWKGIALWKASKKNQIYWFAILLVFNTMGILPIIYLIKNYANTDMEKNIINKSSKSIKHSSSKKHSKKT